MHIILYLWQLCIVFWHLCICRIIIIGNLLEKGGRQLYWDWILEGWDQALEHFGGQVMFLFSFVFLFSFCQNCEYLCVCNFLLKLTLFWEPFSRSWRNELSVYPLIFIIMDTSSYQMNLDPETNRKRGEGEACIAIVLR
jgi:hypothetical protein